MVETLLRVADTDGFAFQCTACGACCNSPPLLSLPELFRFQRIFVGCLAVRRLNAGSETARHALLDRLAFRVTGLAGTTHVAITPQGYGFESDAHCPALQTDGRCALHMEGKPAQCLAVPLDPLVPNQSQGSVLRERLGDAAFHRAGCLSEAEAPASGLTLGANVVDEDFSGALTKRRAGLAADARVWGSDVFAMLGRDPAALLAIPRGGFMALSMAPALMAVAGISPACRGRCESFLHAQLALIEEAVLGARVRRRAEDRPVTRRLLAWAETYRDLLRAFQGSAFACRLTGGARDDVAAWLGCDNLSA